MNSASPAILCAVAHARWLAEIAVALDHAERLALSFCAQPGNRGEALLLRAHIATLRDEVDALRKRRDAPAETCPKRM